MSLLLLLLIMLMAVSASWAEPAGVKVTKRNLSVSLRNSQSITRDHNVTVAAGDEGGFWNLLGMA